MVNPAKLDAARRDSICEQCHLAGEARVEKPGKQLAVFRPAICWWTLHHTLCLKDPPILA